MLPGPWRASEADETLRRDFPLENLDDGDWPEVIVPGAWRSNPAFAAANGPLLYRTRFTTSTPGPDRRTFLEFAGVTVQGRLRVRSSLICWRSQGRPVPARTTYWPWKPPVHPSAILTRNGP